jgi:hypothetical protein
MVGTDLTPRQGSRKKRKQFYSISIVNTSRALTYQSAQALPGGHYQPDTDMKEKVDAGFLYQPAFFPSMIYS